MRGVCGAGSGTRGEPQRGPQLRTSARVVQIALHQTRGGLNARAQRVPVHPQRSGGGAGLTVMSEPHLEAVRDRVAVPLMVIAVSLQLLLALDVALGKEKAVGTVADTEESNDQPPALQEESLPR